MNTHPRHGWSRVEIISVITRNDNVRVKIEVFMVQRYSESPEMGVYEDRTFRIFRNTAYAYRIQF